MARKKYRYGELSREEQMRLDSELQKYLIYADDDEEQENELGIREDAPDDVKDYYARIKWEEEELARTGMVID